VSSDDPVLQEAVARFIAHYDHVRSNEPMREPTAVTLATANAMGQPFARTVLLKGVDPSGFVFYTNSLSRKGRDLSINARAALLFFWQGPLEQVQVEGTVSEVSVEEAEAYWSSRARESQVGAWASLQSEPLASREELDGRFASFDAQFGVEVARPSHWLGYRVRPERIEFWSGGAHRLNHRESYERGAAGWFKQLLYP